MPVSRMVIRVLVLSVFLLMLFAVAPKDHPPGSRPTPALETACKDIPGAQPASKGPAPRASSRRLASQAPGALFSKTSKATIYPVIPPTKAASRKSGQVPASPQLRRLDLLIKKYARLHGVEEDLVWAVIRQESGFNPKAVSPKGAMGLMQLMPETAALMGVTDAFEVEQNIAGGVKFLSLCLRRFQGDICLALAAYNAGPDNVIKYQGCPPFPETLIYVAAVARELSGHPRLKGLRLASFNFPAAAESNAPAPKQSGLDWKVPAPQFKINAPEWKVPEPQWKVSGPTLRKYLRQL